MASDKKKKKKEFLYIFRSVHTMRPTEDMQWLISFYVRMWFTWLLTNSHLVLKAFKSRKKNEQSLRLVPVIQAEMSLPCAYLQKEPCVFFPYWHYSLVGKKFKNLS